MLNTQSRFNTIILVIFFNIYKPLRFYAYDINNSSRHKKLLKGYLNIHFFDLILKHTF